MWTIIEKFTKSALSEDLASVSASKDDASDGSPGCKCLANSFKNQLMLSKSPWLRVKLINYCVA